MLCSDKNMINNKNKFFVFGVVIALFLWNAEAILHVTVFRTGSFTEELFPLHDLNELWMRFIIVSIVLFAGILSQHMANKISKAYEKERMITEKLEASIKEIKLLHGILPICASCKKIRDDKGYWDEVEAYIEKNSEAQFSHGICPDCIKKLYPEYSQEDQ